MFKLQYLRCYLKVKECDLASDLCESLYSPPGHQNVNVMADGESRKTKLALW